MIDYSAIVDCIEWFADRAKFTDMHLQWHFHPLVTKETIQEAAAILKGCGAVSTYGPSWVEVA